MRLKNLLLSMELPWKNATRSSKKPFYLTFEILDNCENC